MNECILPSDFQQAGMITDDEIASLVIHPLPDGVRLTAVMDCCHRLVFIVCSYSNNKLFKLFVITCVVCLNK